jgi:hypothetical protein
MILWYDPNNPKWIAEGDEDYLTRLVGSAMLVYGFEKGQQFIITEGRDRLRKKGVPIVKQGADLLYAAAGYFDQKWHQGIQKYLKNVKMGLR